MARYYNPQAYIPQGITRPIYDPFVQGNDIEFYPWGSDFNDSFHAQRNQPDNSNARPICLRGPMVLTGWGYGVDGNFYPMPSGFDTEGTTNIAGASGQGPYPNYLKNSQVWKTGPIDLLWDNMRGVWTSHDMLFGKTLGGGLPAMGSGLMEIYDLGQDTGQQMLIYNPFSIGVSGSVRIQATYNMTSNIFMLSSADCQTS